MILDNFSNYEQSHWMTSSFGIFSLNAAHSQSKFGLNGLKTRKTDVEYVQNEAGDFKKETNYHR